MKDLLKYQIRSLFHSKMLYFYLGFSIAMTIIGYILLSSVTGMTKEVSKVFPSIIGSIQSEPDFIGQIFIIVFVCNEFQNGTIKNIISRGYTRAQFLFSKCVGAWIGVFCMNLAYVVLSFILYGKNGIGFETNMIYSILLCFIAALSLTVFYTTIGFLLEKNIYGIMTIIFIPRVFDLLSFLVYRGTKVEIDKYWITGILPAYLENPTIGNIWLPILLLVGYAIIFYFLGCKISWKKEIK